MRMVVSWSPSPRLRANALFLSRDEGLFKPQKGQLSTEPEMSFLQFGQRREFLLVEEVINHLLVETGGFTARHPVSKICYLSKTLLIQVSYGKVRVLFVMIVVVFPRNLSCRSLYVNYII